MTIHLIDEHREIALALLNRCQLLEALIFTCETEEMLQYVTEYIQTYTKFLHTFHSWQTHYTLPSVFTITNEIRWKGQYTLAKIDGGARVPILSDHDVLELHQLSTALTAWNQLTSHISFSDEVARCALLVKARLLQTSIPSHLKSYFTGEALAKVGTTSTWGVCLDTKQLVFASSPTNPRFKR